jgi:broad specificity phosphatase PhoE
MQQARALGTSLADIPFAHIHASDLKRATATAEALQSGQTADPKPPLTRTAQIREQNFGIAEGKPWLFEMKPGKTLEEHYAEGIFPILGDSAAKYPEGESTQDLQKRAAQAIKDIVIPYVWDAARTGKREVHIALVSGACTPSNRITLASRIQPGLELKSVLRYTFSLGQSKELH